MASTKDEILDRLVAEQQQDEKATADAVARREASRAAADAATAAARKRIETTYERFLETVAALSAHADAFCARGFCQGPLPGKRDSRRRGDPRATAVGFTLNAVGRAIEPVLV